MIHTVAASDMHIHDDSRLDRISALCDYLEAQAPPLLVLVGDIADPWQARYPDILRIRIRGCRCILGMPGFLLRLKFLLRSFSGWTSRTLDNLAGDVIVYTTADVRSRNHETRQKRLSGAVDELGSLLESLYDKVVVVGHFPGKPGARGAAPPTRARPPGNFVQNEITLHLHSFKRLSLSAREGARAWLIPQSATWTRPSGSISIIRRTSSADTSTHTVMSGTLNPGRASAASARPTPSTGIGRRCARILPQVSSDIDTLHRDTDSTAAPGQSPDRKEVIEKDAAG